jgi:catechol 2,3-dioxygenase-like lactoylglutathione lyase family enzyme
VSTVSGPVVQLAWVTGDIDATERLVAGRFGVRSWTRIPDVVFGPDTTTFRGAPVTLTQHVSLGYSGDLQLELIQPVDDAGFYREFLDAHGTRLHHVCFGVDDLAAACAAAEAAGSPVLLRGSMMDGEIEFAYVDSSVVDDRSAAGAPYVELARIGPQMQAFYDVVRAG